MIHNKIIDVGTAQIAKYISSAESWLSDGDYFYSLKELNCANRKAEQLSLELPENYDSIRNKAAEMGYENEYRLALETRDNDPVHSADHLCETKKYATILGRELPDGFVQFETAMNRKAYGIELEYVKNIILSGDNTQMFIDGLENYVETLGVDNPPEIEILRYITLRPKISSDIDDAEIALEHLLHNSDISGPMSHAAFGLQRLGEYAFSQDVYDNLGFCVWRLYEDNQFDDIGRLIYLEKEALARLDKRMNISIPETPEEMKTFLDNLPCSIEIEEQY